MMGAFWITFTFWVGRTHSCVVTEHTRVVSEGSDVHLFCNISSCPRLRGQSASLEWEFNQTSVPIFHYANRSVIRWPNVKFMGNIAAGDFSIILSSVTYERSGTYLCRFRPPHSPVIYKNYTQLTVIYRRSGGHAGHELSQNRSQDASDNIVAPSPWLLSMYCYIVGLLLVVVTGWALAWWFRWRRALAKNGVQRKDERMTIHKGDPQPPHGNQDTYVTLQRCKNPPPPSPQREGIYVTMVSCGLYVNRAFLLGLRNGSLYSVYSWKQRTPGAVDPTVQSGRSRKGIPLEWYARTDVTLPGKISSG
ncbi:uncharacterized protein LOC108932337 isoform X2 [Scleropages formosus]|uniref:uncharacterized protein LOC108932337 isoform X2 n=1 Tax=Scleropages formosus TaxID=113540 RepID=UPI0010FAB0D1|nr:uncharacterized protein LOC108932337 isoform X2 [Scleropages formosus]